MAASRGCRSAWSRAPAPPRTSSCPSARAIRLAIVFLRPHRSDTVMNPLRQTNQGCRACLAGEYHEDFGLPRCVPCGSSCPPGYSSEGAPWQTCGPSVSTARLIGTAEIPANLAIGCQPCALPTALVGVTQYVSLFDGMHYVDGCDFSCAAPGFQQLLLSLSLSCNDVAVLLWCGP